MTYKVLSAILASILLAVSAFRAAADSPPCAGDCPATEESSESQGPLDSEIERFLRAHPEVLFEIILDNSEEFIATMNEAAREAQRLADERAVEEEKQKRLAQFEDPFVPEIDLARPLRGAPDAPITIVEYGDFQCPYCSRAAPIVKEVLERYDGKVRFFFKNLPLDFHPHALPAATYFEAIAVQDRDKAWQFHDRVFENQDLLSGGEESLRQLAVDLKVDMVTLDRELEDQAILVQIQADADEAAAAGFTGTPGFLINGVALPGAYPVEDFAEIIDEWLRRLEVEKPVQDGG